VARACRWGTGKLNEYKFLFGNLKGRRSLIRVLGIIEDRQY
jgi:hypothetical protein